MTIGAVGFTDYGGSVAILVANMLANEDITVDNLITIGTPVRNDYQLTQNTIVGQHINVYNTGDIIQKRGGSILKGGWALHSAGRTFAETGNVNNQRVIPRGGGTYHNFMHNDLNIWENHIKPFMN
ncbi:MAG: hypothetical protein LBD23_17540 [Oscillospiraceae bacterium]|jgi:hypothetical protein|nr:hypothetical protein [Oscillospiraceae bacterium]